MIWKDFILAHDGDDLARLVLSRDRYPEVDVPLAVSTIECRRRLRDKVPEWYARPELVFPARLSAEQCSSTATARYKAALAAPGRVADLTGGLGVDSWAFSQVSDGVLYNEASAALCEAARGNFAALGAAAVRVRCHRVGEVPLEEILDGFCPDVIYLDPARRDEGGRKVFLLEDCSPDVTALLPGLLNAAPRVMLKLSPMADIAMLLRRLPHTREVHVVAARGECKELLVMLERGFEGEPAIVAADVSGEVHTLRFTLSEAREARMRLASPEAGMLLFEPGKALSKAGCFSLLSERMGLGAAGRDSHLYLMAGEAVPEEPWASMGKWFRLREVLPLDKRSIALAGAQYPDADVSARGVPLSSDDLARRIRSAAQKAPRRPAAASVPIHLFAVHSDLLGQHLLLITEKLFFTF